jgi:hypothetical protein
VPTQQVRRLRGQIPIPPKIPLKIRKVRFHQISWLTGTSKITTDISDSLTALNNKKMFLYLLDFEENKLAIFIRFIIKIILLYQHYIYIIIYTVKTTIHGSIPL